MNDSSGQASSCCFVAHPTGARAGLIFGVGRCTAMNLKTNFHGSALLTGANDFIKFPKGEAETRRAIQAFQEISCFPQLVGAIHGSHIPIIAPKYDPNDYYNRSSSIV